METLFIVWLGGIPAFMIPMAACVTRSYDEIGFKSFSLFMGLSVFWPLTFLYTASLWVREKSGGYLEETDSKKRIAKKKEELRDIEEDLGVDTSEFLPYEAKAEWEMREDESEEEEDDEEREKVMSVLNEASKRLTWWNGDKWETQKEETIEDMEQRLYHLEAQVERQEGIIRDLECDILDLNSQDSTMEEKIDALQDQGDDRLEVKDEDEDQEALSYETVVYDPEDSVSDAMKKFAEVAKKGRYSSHRVKLESFSDHYLNAHFPHQESKVHNGEMEIHINFDEKRVELDLYGEGKDLFLISRGGVNELLRAIGHDFGSSAKVYNLRQNLENLRWEMPENEEPKNKFMGTLEH